MQGSESNKLKITKDEIMGKLKRIDFKFLFDRKVVCGYCYCCIYIHRKQASMSLILQIHFNYPFHNNHIDHIECN